MPTKTPSIISTIITVLLLLLTAAIGMFGLLVALNGFTGSEGTPALTTSLICNGVGIILAAVLAWKLPKWLIGKFNWNSILAVFVSILVGFFVGGGFSFVSLVVGVIVAEAIWNAR